MAPAFKDLSLPSRSTADSLRDEVGIGILSSHDKGYLPLACPHPLEGASAHKQSSVYKIRGTKMNSFTTPPSATCSIPFHQCPRLLWCFNDGGSVANLLVPLWAGEPSSPTPPPIVKDHPVKLAGKLPQSRQAGAGPNHPAAVSATQGYRMKST